MSTDPNESVSNTVASIPEGAGSAGEHGIVVDDKILGMDVQVNQEGSTSVVGADSEVKGKPIELEFLLLSGVRKRFVFGEETNVSTVRVILVGYK